MNPREYLGKAVTIKIDRPMGSRHPKHDFIYPVNYGHIENTVSPDGEELDAYLLGVHEPVDHFEGICIAVIERSNDNDPKLVVVPSGKEYTDEAVAALTEFQEKYFQSTIVRTQ